MREIIHECKFNNCQHINEPKCAVKKALEADEIYENRYYSYVQLMEEDETEVYRKNDYK